MRKAFVLIVLITVLMPAGVASLAQGPTSQPGGTPPPQLILPKPSAVQAMRLLSPRVATSLATRLSLSDAQKTQVTDLLTKADEALKPKVEAQHKAVQEFVVAMADGAANEAALNAAAEKAAKAELAIVADKVKTLMQLRALLTDQQKAGFNKYIEDMTRSWRVEGPSPFAGTPMPAPAAPAIEAKPEPGAK